MNTDLRIYYKDNFEINFLFTPNREYAYEFVVHTLGINEFRAFCEPFEGGWVCKNCRIIGNEITIAVNKHNLPPGKVSIQVMSEAGFSVIDPHIILTLQKNVSETILPDSPIDLDQSFDIIKLKEDLKNLKDQISQFEGYLDGYNLDVQSIAKAHHLRLDSLDEKYLSLINLINSNNGNSNNDTPNNDSNNDANNTGEIRFITTDNKCVAVAKGIVTVESEEYYDEESIGEWDDEEYYDEEPIGLWDEEE